MAHNRKEMLCRITEAWMKQGAKTAEAIWRAYKLTLNTPCNKLTPAELAIQDAFYQLGVTTSFDENGNCHYKTPFGSFSTMED